MKYELILSLLMTSLVISVFLSVKPVSEICSPGQGCNTVLSSKYSQILGIKNSILGIFALATLLIMTYLETKNPTKKKRAIIHVGILTGAAVAFYFLYIQFFVIKSLCKYCLIVDISLILSLIITISLWKK